MARTKQDKTTKTATKTKAKPAARPGRPRTRTQTMDELRLGKFDEARPLQMPEQKPNRAAQIIGGLGMLLATIVAVYALLLTDPLQTMMSSSDWSSIYHLPWYWMVMEAAVLLAVPFCLVSSIMLLVGKRVLAMIWYILIVLAMVAVLCRGFQTYTWYEERNCYNNYPGIAIGDQPGSGCPSVRNELIWLNLCSLGIYTLGIIALVVVRKISKRYHK